MYHKNELPLCDCMKMQQLRTNQHNFLISLNIKKFFASS